MTMLPPPVQQESLPGDGLVEIQRDSGDNDPRGELFRVRAGGQLVSCDLFRFRLSLRVGCAFFRKHAGQDRGLIRRRRSTG